MYIYEKSTPKEEIDDTYMVYVIVNVLMTRKHTEQSVFPLHLVS